MARHGGSGATASAVRISRDRAVVGEVAVGQRKVVPRADVEELVALGEDVEVVAERRRRRAAAGRPPRWPGWCRPGARRRCRACARAGTRGRSPARPAAPRRRAGRPRCRAATHRVGDLLRRRHAEPGRRHGRLEHAQHVRRAVDVDPVDVVRQPALQPPPGRRRGRSRTAPAQAGPRSTAPNPWAGPFAAYFARFRAFAGPLVGHSVFPRIHRVKCPNQHFRGRYRGVADGIRIALRYHARPFAARRPMVGLACAPRLRAGRGDRRRRRRLQRGLPLGPPRLDRRRARRAARTDRGHHLALGRLRRPAALDHQPDPHDHVLVEPVRRAARPYRAGPGLAGRRRVAAGHHPRAGRGAAPAGRARRPRTGWSSTCSPRPRRPNGCRCSAVDDVLAAGWLPGDGYLEPAPLARALAAGATALGTRIVTGVRVTGFDVAGGRVRAVHTDQGTVRTDVVVDAAGAAAGAVGAAGRSGHPDRPDSPPVRGVSNR